MAATAGSRVRAVRVDVLDVPFRVPVVTAEGRWTVRRLALVRLFDGDGLEGVGEAGAGAPGGLGRGVAWDVAAELATALAGLEPADDGELEARLATPGASALARPELRSAIATAAVDLAARRAGVPLAGWAADGGFGRDRVRVNGLIGIAPASAAAARAATLVAQGYRCLKLKGMDEPPAVLSARVAAVRSAVGPAVRLRLDVNGAWPSVAAAVASLKPLAPFELEYVEQPLPVAAGLAALAAVRREGGVPVAADEAVTDLAAAEELLSAGAADVLVVKPARVGGFRAARRLADRAAEAGVGVVVSTLFETGIGIATALHLAATLSGPQRAHGLATADLLATDLLVEPLAVRRGWMAVPRGPGLGVALDVSAVGRHRAGEAGA